MRKRLALPALAAATVIALGAAPAASDAGATPKAAAATEANGSAASTSDYAGHTYRLTLDNGTVLRNTYSEDGKTLNWVGLAGPLKGKSGEEDLQVRKVRQGVYFVSWVEDSGVTVSHVMDLPRRSVDIFWTFGTEDGGRLGELHTATLRCIS